MADELKALSIRISSSTIFFFWSPTIIAKATSPRASTLENRKYLQMQRMYSASHADPFSIHSKCKHSTIPKSAVHSTMQPSKRFTSRSLYYARHHGKTSTQAVRNTAPAIWEPTSPAYSAALSCRMSLPFLTPCSCICPIIPCVNNPAPDGAPDNKNYVFQPGETTL